MDKLKVGIIGVGSVVREIYQYLYFRSDYTHLLDIVAVADPNDEYRNWFGDTFNIPENRRFKDYNLLLQSVELDAVQVNTPDHLHSQPTIAALEAGCDVVVPKPTAATVKETHAMIEAARRTGRLMGIDFHKREDPRIKEAEARYQSGRYGQLQSTVWYMLDKLCVADPNHQPPFFASPNFAAQNTPISFLTVHMADALMKIVDLKPLQVRAIGYSHKLPSLEPIGVKGYDLCDTEIVFENGAVAHIITGWHLPNTAHALTVQSSRLICTDGMIDLDLDCPGYHELHAQGIAEINPLFRNFEKDGLVTGYGMASPGRIYQKILASRNDSLHPAVRDQMMTANELGFFTSVVLEAAEESLQKGTSIADGVTSGITIDCRELIVRELGQEAAASYLG